MSLDITGLVADVHVDLRAVAAAERREFMARTCASKLTTLGVKSQDIRRIHAELCRRVRGAPPEEIKALATALVQGGTLEGRQIGYLLLDKHRAALATLTHGEILALGEGADNWASVDTFAGLIAGSAWRRGRIQDDVVHGWLESEDRWWRRAGVVCTVALNQKARGGTGDPERTLEVCGRVVDDRDDMVVKALSWALRELAKREPGQVEAFMARHGDALAPRVRREVRNKLETGLKNR
jgi:3-methyladenine DNA glycosylase AlkD